MFWTVPLSVIRSFSLCTQQWYMSYRFADSLRAGSGWNCPKHAEFYSKNKFEKLVRLVGFIIRKLRYSQQRHQMGLTGQQNPRSLYSRTKYPVTHWVVGWVSPRATLDAVQERKPYPCR